MKENYKQALLEVTLFPHEDIVTASASLSLPLDSGGNYDDGGWT